MAETEQAEVLFRSKGAAFRAIRIPRRRWEEQGEVRTSAGVDYDFKPNGEFRTSDPEAIEHLRSLPSFNLEFWEVGAEPGAPPSSDLVHEAIAAASIELDDERLAEIEAEEQATHQRGDVLKAVAAARRQVQGLDQRRPS